LKIYYAFDPWGLRPRLYASACFAGLNVQMGAHWTMIVFVVLRAFAAQSQTQKAYEAKSANEQQEPPSMKSCY